MNLLDISQTPPDPLYSIFRSAANGLSSAEAAARLKENGMNEPAPKKKRTLVAQIVSKFVNPLVIVLLVVGGFSYSFGEKMSALLVLVMVLASVTLSFVQE